MIITFDCKWRLVLCSFLQIACNWLPQRCFNFKLNIFLNLSLILYIYVWFCGVTITVYILFIFYLYVVYMLFISFIKCSHTCK